MKVILHQDIRGVGKKNEIKNVSDGYAKNLLFPKMMAEPATPQAIKRLEDFRARQTQDNAETKRRLETLAKEIKSHSIEFKVKAGGDGSVFGSVTKDMIQKSIQTSFKTSDKIEVILEHPIKKIGEHEVSVDLKKGIQSTLKVIVKSE